MPHTGPSSTSSANSAENPFMNGGGNGGGGDGGGANIEAGHHLAQILMEVTLPVGTEVRKWKDWKGDIYHCRK